DFRFLQDGKSVKRKRTRQQRWVVCRKAGVAMALLTLLAIAFLSTFHGRRDSVLRSSKSEVNSLVSEFRSANPKVNNLVARGNHLMLSATSENLDAALTFFNEAAALEPDFVPAYVGIFTVRMRQQWGHR